MDGDGPRGSCGPGGDAYGALADRGGRAFNMAAAGVGPDCSAHVECDDGEDERRGVGVERAR